MKWYLKAAAAILGIGILMLLLPLMVGIWPPDVISAPVNLLAEERLANGETVRVIQYWNRCDFYSTELEHIGPDGKKQNITLDGDDAKSWRTPMVVAWDKNEATVTRGGGRRRIVNWKTEEWRQ